jgi:putative FmdB family regulatory protein
MPLYEYYCEPCNLIYEALRPIREASSPVPCPECSRDGRRIMSTFMAFSYRDGYPRRLPDRGTYWHLEKEVKTLPKQMRHYEHPELAEPKPVRRPTKGEKAEQRDRVVVEQKEKKRRDKWGVSDRGYPTKK